MNVKESLAALWRNFLRSTTVFALAIVVVALVLWAAFSAPTWLGLSDGWGLSAAAIVLLIVAFGFAKWLANVFAQKEAEVVTEDHQALLFDVSYTLTILIFLLSVLPFVFFPRDPSVRDFFSSSQIGLLQGCRLMSERTPPPTELLCHAGAPGQWIVNVGGTAVPRSASIEPLLARATEALRQARSDLTKLADDDTKSAVATAIDEIENQLGKIREGLEDKNRQIEFHLEAAARAQGEARDGLPMLSSRAKGLTTAIDEIGRLLGEIRERRGAVDLGYEISGGIVVPLYFVVIALFGASVSMMRRVPEYQRRSSKEYNEQGTQADAEGEQRRPSPLKPLQVREYLLFQILQVFSAPFIALAAYAVIAPEQVAATVAVAFISGFASEAILLRIRQTADSLGAERQEQNPTKPAPSATEPTPEEALAKRVQVAAEAADALKKG